MVGHERKKKWHFPYDNAFEFKIFYGISSHPAQFRERCLCVLLSTLWHQEIKVQALQGIGNFVRCPDLQNASDVGS